MRLSPSYMQHKTVRCWLWPIGTVVRMSWDHGQPQTTHEFCLGCISDKVLHLLLGNYITDSTEQLFASRNIQPRENWASRWTTLSKTAFPAAINLSRLRYICIVWMELSALISNSHLFSNSHRCWASICSHAAKLATTSEPSCHQSSCFLLIGMPCGSYSSLWPT